MKIRKARGEVYWRSRPSAFLKIQPPSGRPLERRCAAAIPREERLIMAVRAKAENAKYRQGAMTRDVGT